MAHQHLPQIINAMVRVNGNRARPARVRRRHVVDPMSEIVQAVELMEYLDLHDGGIWWAVWGVSCGPERWCGGEIVVLGGRKGVYANAREIAPASVYLGCGIAFVLGDGAGKVEEVAEAGGLECDCFVLDEGFGPG